MSSFIFPENYSHSVSLREAGAIRKKINQTRVRRLLVVAIFVLVVLIIFQLIWSFLISPQMKLKGVDVISQTQFPLNPSTLKAVIGLDTGDSYPNIDVKRVESLIMRNLMVESVVVEKKFPDRLIIHVKERVPLAMFLLTNKSGRMYPVELDREGIVLSAGNGVTYYDLPVLSGDFIMPQPIVGSHSEGVVISILQELNEIALQDSELYQLISEIKIIDKGSDNFELLLYIRGHHVPVLFKQNFAISRLLRVIGSLDALQDTGEEDSMVKLDYRSDICTYIYHSGVLNAD